jgi:hypothetical protein
MDMVGIHMVEVNGMDMVKERPSNHRLEVEDMDRADMTIEVELIEREHKGVVLERHWTGDGAERHHHGRREWEELAKLWYSECHTTFVSLDSNCLTWRRV